MLKENEIYFKDCLEGMKELPDGSVDLLLTDPPYNVSNTTKIVRNGGKFGKAKTIDMDFGDWDMRTEMNGLTKANFPLELPLNCIDLLSYVGDVVLDPFSGSGTTLISSEMRKRKWVGIELSEKYCKIAMNRIKVVSEQNVLTDYGVV